jgi:hypothetical protein
MESDSPIHLLAVNPPRSAVITYAASAAERIAASAPEKLPACAAQYAAAAGCVSEPVLKPR